MSQKIDKTQTQLFTGPGTVLTHGATAAQPATGYSLHDCANPGQVGAHNCIWPIGGAAGPLTFNKGLVAFTRDPTFSGTITVNTL